MRQRQRTTEDTVRGRWRQPVGSFSDLPGSVNVRMRPSGTRRPCCKTGDSVWALSHFTVTPLHGLPEDALPLPELMGVGGQRRLGQGWAPWHCVTVLGAADRGHKDILTVGAAHTWDGWLQEAGS